jgi:hypothetical protein
MKIAPEADDAAGAFPDAVPMNATSTTTHCDSCSGLVEGAQHLLLCDSCLDARLAQLERSVRRPPRWTGTLRWPTAARSDGLGSSLTFGDVLRTAI